MLLTVTQKYLYIFLIAQCRNIFFNLITFFSLVSTNTIVYILIKTNISEFLRLIRYVLISYITFDLYCIILFYIKFEPKPEKKWLTNIPLKLTIYYVT